MCTMIVEKAEIAGAGRGQQGWFRLSQANVAFDHPDHMDGAHAVNIDFVNPARDWRQDCRRTEPRVSPQAGRDHPGNPGPGHASIGHP